MTPCFVFYTHGIIQLDMSALWELRQKYYWIHQVFIKQVCLLNNVLLSHCFLGANLSELGIYIGIKQNKKLLKEYNQEPGV